MAGQGALFSSGYAAASVCAPSRCGLLTGRSPARFGVQTNPIEEDPKAPGQGLPPTEKIFPQLLRQAGYATGLIGKWHLGETDSLHPLARGFDSFYGFLGGGEDYFKSKKILRNHSPVAEPGYLTDTLTQEALTFIERHQDHPFFLMLSYNAVHSPMQAVEAWKTKLASSISDEGRLTAAAMTLALDEGIGKVLEKLKSLGLEKESLVFFASDNGAKLKYKTSNGALRGEKGTLYEGGIRVPLLVRYPAVITSGIQIQRPVTLLDIAPTILDCVGVQATPEPGLDGESLLHALEDVSRPRSFFWKFGPSAGAVRRGKWKYLKTWNDESLFDLESDPCEKINRASDSPELSNELKKVLTDWEKSLPAPLWGPPQWFKKS